MQPNHPDKNQIIAFLRERKKELSQTVLCVEKILLLIERRNMNAGRVTSLEAVGTSALKAVEEFNPRLKLNQKIAYVLHKSEKAFKEDILSELAALQPELSLTKLDNALSVALSHLLGSGKIMGTKIGRRYCYSLIEPEEEKEEITEAELPADHLAEETSN